MCAERRFFLNFRKFLIILTNKSCFAVKKAECRIFIYICIMNYNDMMMSICPNFSRLKSRLFKTDQHVVPFPERLA